MDQYEPSGKHPPLIKMFSYTLATGVLVGALSGPLIVLSNSFILKLHVASRAGGAGVRMGIFPILQITLVIWAIAILPFLMGAITGTIPSSKSRNPRISGFMGFLGAGIALMSMVGTVMAMKGMTFGNWLSFSWTSMVGPGRGFTTNSFLHLIPILFLFAGSMFSAVNEAKKPFCERCLVACREFKVGEVPNLRKDAKPEEILGRGPFVSGLQKSVDKMSLPVEWGDLSIMMCEKCEKTGFLKVVACRLSQGKNQKRKLEKKEIFPALPLNEAQLEDIRKFLPSK